MLLTVAYHGAPFSGFARQPEARTVAGELDGAVRAIDPRASLVRGVSRTDAGVHARAQRVAFDTARSIPARGWCLALARELPSEVAVVRAAAVPVGYDPRGHARSKTYRYTVLESELRDPFLDGVAWRIPDRLNQMALAEEAAALEGEHDFAAFRTSADTRTDTRRTITAARVHTDPQDSRLIQLHITGNAFLHRMVRIIAGTLVDVGRGRLRPGAVRRALECGDRRTLGVTAPPQGLCLMEVVLDDEGAEAWPAG